MGDAIDRIIEKIEAKVNEYINQAEADMITAANETNDLYFDQVNKMYDDFIKQYYLYKTKSYVRHWELGPGTRKGSNLYYGKKFKKHRGKDPYFEIDIDASEMANNYQHDSATQVLQNVMNGIRGVPPYWFEPWYGKYSSRYFSYQGDPAHAFETFMDNYSDMAGPAFLRRYKRLRK